MYSLLFEATIARTISMVIPIQKFIFNSNEKKRFRMENIPSRKIYSCLTYEWILLHSMSKLGGVSFSSRHFHDTPQSLTFSKGNWFSRNSYFENRKLKWIVVQLFIWFRCFRSSAVNSFQWLIEAHNVWPLLMNSTQLFWNFIWNVDKWVYPECFCTPGIKKGAHLYLSSSLS